jgi:glucosyl-3-phosphoglycerate phosphatase
MTTPGRLIVLRHGCTRWNATRRFQGQADPPLDHVGRRQARQAAEAIAPLDPQLIVSSDLRRARQTAYALGTRCHLPVKLDRPRPTSTGLPSSRSSVCGQSPPHDGRRPLLRRREPS